MHDHTLQERNPAIWSQQNRKTGTQNTFVLSVKPSVFKGCRGRAIFYFPIWWGTLPRILDTFFDTYDFSGKTIVPFCTSGSSGIDTALARIRELEPDADVKAGARIDVEEAQEQLSAWLEELSLRA